MMKHLELFFLCALFAAATIRAAEPDGREWQDPSRLSLGKEPPSTLTAPVEIGGVYPSLAYYNDEGECGTGASKSRGLCVPLRTLRTLRQRPQGKAFDHTAPMAYR